MEEHCLRYLGNDLVLLKAFQSQPSNNNYNTLYSLYANFCTEFSAQRHLESEPHEALKTEKESPFLPLTDDERHAVVFYCRGLIFKILLHLCVFQANEQWTEILMRS